MVELVGMCYFWQPSKHWCFSVAIHNKSASYELVLKNGDCFVCLFLPGYDCGVLNSPRASRLPQHCVPSYLRPTLPPSQLPRDRRSRPRRLPGLAEFAAGDKTIGRLSPVQCNHHVIHYHWVFNSSVLIWGYLILLFPGRSPKLFTAPENLQLKSIR